MGVILKFGVDREDVVGITLHLSKTNNSGHAYIEINAHTEDTTYKTDMTVLTRNLKDDYDTLMELAVTEMKSYILGKENL